jgi:hypothetical protein
MSAQMERAKYSKNFGAKNGVLDRKILAFEALGIKWSFEEVLGALV